MIILREKKKCTCFDHFQLDEQKPINQITREDFEEAMRYARRSVTDLDIRRYELFAQNLQQAKGADANNFRFPPRENTVGGDANPNFQPNEDPADDLYA